MRVPNCLNIIFFVFGIVASTFYGFKAFDIFEVSVKQKPWAWKVHQFWFNFTGSLIGWFLLWLLIQKVWLGMQTFSLSQIGILDIVILLISFIGITGYLPFGIASLLQSLKELTQKFLGLLKWGRKGFVLRLRKLSLSRGRTATG